MVSAEIASSVSGPQHLEASIVGLLSGATYHYRVVAKNSFGTTFGQDETGDERVIKVLMPKCLGQPLEY